MKIGWVGMIGIGLILIFGQVGQGRTDTGVPEVIVNEVAWAGSSASSSDEWIELKNTTDADIDLSGWQITINALDITLPENSIIPANGFYLIAKYKTGHPNSALNVAVDLDRESKQFSISNNGFVITLQDATGQTEDIAWDSTKLPSSGYGYRNSDDSGSASLERKAPIGKGDDKTSWQEATDSINFDDIKDLGTPKADNSIPPAILPSPIITSITPEETSATDNFVLDQIDGDNFAMTDGLQIKLQNGTQEIWATDWQVLSPMLIINIEFDLTDAETGAWDVVVINPDQPPAILMNALTILELEDEPGDYSNADIQISEIYPHPTTGANSEFIELYNAGDNSVNLKGWQLDDQFPGGSAVYTINTDTIIESHQYYVFEKLQTKISLNDTGDYVRLLNPQAALVETTPNYGSANLGEAYAKINDSWEWTLRPTPQAANVWENPIEPEEETTPTDDDPYSLQPNEIVIALDYDDLTSTSVLLTWQISLIGAIGELELYQSDNKTTLGEVMANPAITAPELTLENLQPDTTYYFTLVGSYNADDIISNQIKVVTKTSGAAHPSTGEAGQYKQIIFTEILPNPESGEEEFIELFNPTAAVVNLSGWKLQDASGRTYTITSFDLPRLTLADIDPLTEVQLEPGQYLLLEYPVTHIRLNNSGGEELQLFDTNNDLVDEMYYDGTAKAGYAYAIAPNQNWFWSDELTPGEANDISFATIDDDGNYYLTDTGKPLPWQAILWISLLFSGIIVAWSIYHAKSYSHH